MNSRQVSRITSRDRAEFRSALFILNEILGTGLFTEESLAKTADGDGSALFGYSVENTIVGVATAIKLKPSDAAFYSLFGDEAARLFLNQVVGSLRESAVSKDHQGQGIGTALLSVRLRWLKEVGCGRAVGLVWLHSGKNRSDRIFRNAGFQQVGAPVKEFYKASSEATGMRCPYCGTPCCCSASMFEKAL
jgi:GNAT superfamily N-acetyltransferase